MYLRNLLQTCQGQCSDRRSGTGVPSTQRRSLLYQPMEKRDEISFLEETSDVGEVDEDEWDPDEEPGLDDPRVIGPRKAIFLVIFAALETLLMSGVIFGWPAIEAMMIEQGQYAELCGEGNQVCPARNLKLTTIFISASSAFALVFWPSGYILDKYGPRVSNLIGCLLLLGGALLFAFSSSVGFDAFLPGYIIMGAAGPSVFLSFLSLSNLFPDHKSTIISLFNVMLDASALDFVILQQINKGLPSADLRMLFLFYSIIPFAGLGLAFCLLPRQSYPAPAGHEGYAEGGAGVLNPFGPEIARKSFKSQVKSKAFLFGTLFTAFQLLRVNFYIGTVAAQLNFLSPDTGEIWTQVFTLVLPVGGVLSIPIVGWFMDRCSLTVSMTALTVAATLFGITNTIPNLYVQAVTFVLMAFFRAFLFGGMSSYVALIFGFTNFGQLWGLIMFTSGILNFISIVVEWATLHYLQSNFLIPNAVLAGTSALLLLFPLWIWRVSKAAVERRKGREGDHHLLLETEFSLMTSD